MPLIHYPMLVEIQDDDVMEELMSDLSSVGFMSRAGLVPITPWVDFVDHFYYENGTMPTHILLTDVSFDACTDGLAVELCGEHEIKHTPQTLLNENIRDIEFEELRRLVDGWIAW